MTIPTCRRDGTELILGETWLPCHHKRDNRICADCARSDVRRWREANVDQDKEITKAWKAANPERVRATYERYRDRDPEALRAKWREARARAKARCSSCVE